MIFGNYYPSTAYMLTLIVKYEFSVIEQVTNVSKIRDYLLRLPPLLVASLGVCVDTIWQCTVPSSNINQIGPNTSVCGTLCVTSAVQNNMIAVTANRRIILCICEILILLIISFNQMIQN